MGKVYDVKIAPVATRQLKKLPPPAQNKIVQCLQSLAVNQRPSGIEKLSHDPRLWRIRAGEYRVIYWIDDVLSVVIALIVRHRQDAYRNLDKLDPAIIAKNPSPLISGLSLAP
jgi:mRNA interferase RelE/StbE